MLLASPPSDAARLLDLANQLASEREAAALALAGHALTKSRNILGLAFSRSAEFAADAAALRRSIPILANLARVD